MYVIFSSSSSNSSSSSSNNRSNSKSSSSNSRSSSSNNCSNSRSNSNMYSRGWPYCVGLLTANSNYIVTFPISLQYVHVCLVLARCTSTLHLEL